MSGFDGLCRSTDLEIRQGGVELDAPVDEAVGAVEDAVVVEFAECFDNGFAEFLYLKDEKS
jgi:hypothetical protein